VAEEAVSETVAVVESLFTVRERGPELAV